MIKTLLLDVETAPNTCFTWGLWDQNISIKSLIKPSYLLCYTAKWAGEKKIHYKDKRDPDMLSSIHEMMSEADVIIHYNGKRFDIPVLHGEFLLHSLTPPAPSRQIDLYQVVKSKFRFPSNKLAYVTEALGLSGKMTNSGFELWIGCMNDDPKSWKEMKKYNIQDVVVLEELYDVLLPWIDSHPNKALYNEGAGCPNCGGNNLVRRGFAYTPTRKFQRYRCSDCGRWNRDTKSIPGSGVEIQAAK